MVEAAPALPLAEARHVVAVEPRAADRSAPEAEVLAATVQDGFAPQQVDGSGVDSEAPRGWALVPADCWAAPPAADLASARAGYSVGPRVGD